MQFSGAFSQSAEILLAGSCSQFGSNKLIKILIDLDINILYFKKDFTYLPLERREGRKKGKETLQPRHVP